jgi:glyceraldehyde-3-phosphate dehydrogenase (NADP+)
LNVTDFYMSEEFFAPLSDNGTPPTYRYFDGKEWKDSTSGKVTEVKSPVDGSVVGKLQVVTHEEIDKAMETAKAAREKWEATPLNQRIKIMHLAADWIRHYQDYLVSVMVMEIGKSVKESKSEIVRTGELMDYYASEAQSIHGDTLDSDNFPGYDKGRIAIMERVAWGVVLCIPPFNYPVNLAASKLAPALLMGNSVVLKPPTQGGISCLHMVQAFIKAGVPEGVITVVTGGGSEIGDYLVGHDKVDMVAFTGSSVTGPAIAGKAAMKPLLFECGGNNPAVVFPDADLKLTAKEIISGGYAYAGQRCTAIKYVMAHQSVLDQLVPVLQEQMQTAVHMGDPRSPETKMVGPVVSEEAAEKIQKDIDDTVAAGAKVVFGGKHDKAYVEPTLLTGVTPAMPAVVHEVFGPVVSFIAVENMDEAVRTINNSPFGLQACVFTKDEGTGVVFANKLNVGTVQINGSPQRGPDHFPFLGVKKSGVGVQGVRYSLEAMSRIHPVVMNKPE